MLHVPFCAAPRRKWRTRPSYCNPGPPHVRSGIGRYFPTDGKPINHYNQTAEEYDGEFDHTLTFSGPHGSFEKQMWPEGSAYPDNFIIGNPHINYYEGSAQIDNLRLYVRG